MEIARTPPAKLHVHGSPMASYTTDKGLALIFFFPPSAGEERHEILAKCLASSINCNFDVVLAAATAAQDMVNKIKGEGFLEVRASQLLGVGG